MKNLKKILSYYKPYKGIFLADMFFALLASATTLTIPIIVRYITQNVIYKPAEEALHTITILGIIMVVLVAVECYSKYFISNYGHVMGAKMEYDSRNICPLSEIVLFLLR